MNCHEILKVLGRLKDSGVILANLILDEKVTSGKQAARTTDSIVRNFGIHRAWVEVQRLRVHGSPGIAEVMSAIIMLCETILMEREVYREPIGDEGIDPPDNDVSDIIFSDGILKWK